MPPVAALDKIASARGFPEFIRCDNGPKLTANALRDWCRFTGTGTSYIEPRSPWESGGHRRPLSRGGLRPTPRPGHPVAASATGCVSAASVMGPIRPLLILRAWPIRGRKEGHHRSPDYRPNVGALGCGRLTGEMVDFKTGEQPEQDVDVHIR
jgi:hypothetical protein